MGKIAGSSQKSAAVTSTGIEYEARIRSNGEAWAAKLELAADAAFWAKWDALEERAQLTEVPAADGKRCQYGCKRRVLFLKGKHRGHDLCDGLCDLHALKI
eukprot:CAMPEP_0119295594 /NCGR_PEP_ID=MMETSP1329-20130426/50046_1 /TAXON_ID=114041 /ORGANISM="Genus nov. species nov., Strain RCC1024" /LENGTH=100 /DNA_ID=CAMNT_0007296513 /DNA_START=160 /DNA_END=459 /DNA_ORIENTATION=-